MLLNIRIKIKTWGFRKSTTAFQTIAEFFNTAFVIGYVMSLTIVTIDKDPSALRSKNVSAMDRTRIVIQLKTKNVIMR